MRVMNTGTECGQILFELAVIMLSGHVLKVGKLEKVLQGAAAVLE